jgi:hypothetical protein
LRIRDKEYLRWLAHFPCVICNIKDGTVVAHHVRIGQAGGVGLKPSDSNCIPLCHTHHMELHNYPLGEETYLAVNGIDHEEKTDEFYKSYLSIL